MGTSAMSPCRRCPVFKISKEFCEELNCQVWSVSRRDGFVIKDGVTAYNFLLDDWDKAIDCAKKLELQCS